MENYIPKELIEAEFQITIDESLDYNEIDLPKKVLESSPIDIYVEARNE